MIFTVSVFTVSALCTLFSVLFKPYVKIGKVRFGLYWVFPFIGAIIILCSAMPFDFALNGLTANTPVNPLKTLALFFSVSLLSLFLGNAGFFDYVAEKVFSKSKNGVRLFVSLYVTVAILTIFTSNDVVILTFTPPVCIFCRKAGISPIPYLFGEFVAANTWSMALIIGNPTNVYLAGSAGIDFFSYFKVMAVPTIVAGLTSFFILLLIFKKPLTAKKDEFVGENNSSVKLNRFLAVVGIIHLAACLILLAIADFIGLQTYLACVFPAASLTLIFIIYGIVKEKSLIRLLNVFKGAPYELIPFIISMFVLSLSLEYCGFTAKLSSALLSNDKVDGISFGFLSAAAANLLNNIPMSVLFERIIGLNSLPATYGAIIGSNIGAFITPVGALAGIMWNKILTGYGFKFPFGKFIKYGVLVAIPTLAVATATLLLFV
ncbi:MAG: ArsB/NhaD family transporter [Clostridia bacterium]|nr:ArsB/NhaD family transporter [Clostridia bacterium]